VLDLGLPSMRRSYHSVAKTSHDARTAVVVLGDLARSPRMLYHALALADAVGDVDLVGYLETPLDSAVRDHPRIHVHPLGPPVTRLPRSMFVAYGLSRTGAQFIRLAYVLLGLPRPRTILVQNPPAIPTLAVALLAARLRGARLIVDWHNYGHAMLALRLSPRHLVVRLARRYEDGFGRRADVHLCVSRAMQQDLATRGVAGRSILLYDRPAARFAPLSGSERAASRSRILHDLGVPQRGRPLAVAVAPTSWTADEDMGLLLDAVGRYDSVAGADAGLPDLLVLLTGTGPLREEFLRRASAVTFEHVHLRARWLEAAEYPTALAVADLGLSLHRSASGLDLPMKVADLLGAGVPVCALGYAPCLAEVVHPGRNGVVFTTAAELATCLSELLRDHQEAGGPLARLRAHILTERHERWDEAWRAAVQPLFGDGRPC